ncbi:MAG: ion channel [Cyclobacteriaceae bacterium]|nr:ion channel [Cyclobacteriaceae bacterium]MDH4295597.1 ion channel [Cyclobacteriaceae bacterium]MDH5247733.1 ion channel [Cyclobacteriaceae bacterium]
MAKKQFNDLGLGTKVARLVNKNGSFNVKRKGQPFTFVNLYQNLIKMTWFEFLALTLSILLIINLLFASLYFFIGAAQMNGLQTGKPVNDFLNCLFFSFQTFTTVGYGHLSPDGNFMSFVAAFEAMTGLMVFAIITGLLYGRFAKPSAKILYSKNLIVAPYQDGLSYQFRITNKRKSVIMDIHARILVSFSGEGRTRTYSPLELERASVVLFPLNWTIVHPVTKDSPLFGKSKEELAKLDAEFIIVIKGYDDTFSQDVNSIHSYRHDEIIWGARFDIMYESDDDGYTVLHVDKLSDYSQYP